MKISTKKYNTFLSLIEREMPRCQNREETQNWSHKMKLKKYSPREYETQI